MTTVYVDSNSPNTPGAGTEANPYRSLSIAEGALPATLGDAYEVVCKSSSGSADTTSAVFSGVTTSATNTLHVYAHADHRHDGKWNTSKYRLEVNAARCVSNGLNNATFSYLQGKTSTTGAYHCFYTATASSVFQSCIAAGTASTGNGFHIDSVAATVKACIAYGCNTGFHFIASSGFARKCTSVNNRVSGFARQTSGTPTAINCYAGGNATSDYTNSITLTNAASADNTGTAGLRTIAVSTSTGAKFVNITAGSEDFHIQSGSSLIDAGTADSNVTVDIDGVSISGTHDIGADEYVAAGGNTYDVSASMGLSAGCTLSRTADLAASVSFGASAGLNQSPATLFDLSALIAASLGVSVGRGADVAGAISIGSTFATTSSAQNALTLGVELGASLAVAMQRSADLAVSVSIPSQLGFLGASQLIAENAAAFGVSVDTASTLGSIFAHDVGLGVLAGLSIAGVRDINSAVSLAVQAGLMPSASASLLAAFVVGLDAGIAAGTTLDAQAAIALLGRLGIACVGQGGSAEEVVASILRTLRVMADSRTLDVDVDVRAFRIPSESRTLKA